jgi:YihY family inner membrane protein
MPAPSDAKLNRRKRLGRIWATIWRGCVKYNETDGEQRAASFAYYALFSLLPLLVLLITVGTRFLGNREEATNQVFRMLGGYMEIDLGSQENVRKVVQGFMDSRLGSGVISALVVLWCALRFFQSLVHGVNKAWGTKEYTWWRLPLKNLLMITILTSALLIGLVVPGVLASVQRFYAEHKAPFMGDFGWLFELARGLLPPLLLFYALILFYKFAPRRPTTLREVWLEAVWVTLLLGVLQKLFAYYAGKAAQFNVVYGAFGSVVALLMWIYLTGAVIILGGCFCAARGEIRRGLTDQSEREQASWEETDEPPSPKF